MLASKQHIGAALTQHSFHITVSASNILLHDTIATSAIHHKTLFDQLAF